MSMGTGVGARLRAARARLRDESAAVAGIRPGSGDPAVLSDEQRRVWLVDRISGGSPEYNVPHAVTAGVHFDPVTFRRALVATVDEHDILRTGYADRDGAPMVCSSPPTPCRSRCTTSRCPTWPRLSSERRTRPTVRST